MLVSGTATVMSVGELNRRAKDMLERGFPLGWVSGEISNLARPASGHVYFTLKDDTAQVRCAMFRSRAQLLPWRLENGMKVEARALVTLFEARGDFQLNVESLRRAGIGNLFEAFCRLRDRLKTEGLFDPAGKRPLPQWPRRVGVVTSLQAAALRDVLAALARRAPHLPVVIYPTAVQGEGAAAQIAAALGAASLRADCDVLILARGGGSLEDLWCFNDEALARAIRACPMPVVSGVGHETDSTIADFAADVRAATPTAAAELVSTGFATAGLRLPNLAHALNRTLQSQIQQRMQRLDVLAYRLIHPGQRLQQAALQLSHLQQRLGNAHERLQERRHQRLFDLAQGLIRHKPDPAASRANLDRLQQRLCKAWRDSVQRQRASLASLAAHLTHLDPQQVLNRGYAIVRSAEGQANGAVLTDAGRAHVGQALHIQLAQGELRAEVTNITSE